MKRSIITRAMAAAVAGYTFGIVGAGLAHAGTDDDFGSGWTEATVGLGVEGQIIVNPTNR